MILCHFCSLPLTVSAAKPDLLQLLEMDFPSRVGPKINDFGTFLLQDTLGNKIAIISENCRGRPQSDGNGGSEGVAGREGGGGVVGQSHSNSEEEQTDTNGRADTDGPRQTLNLFHVNCCFVLYDLFFYLIFILFLIFQLFLLYHFNFSLYNSYIFCITIRLCFCIFA